MTSSLYSCHTSAPPPLAPEAAKGQCADSSQPLATASSQAALGTGTATDVGVTFYKDLLPILQSNVRGSVYKCTACHSEYATPAGLSSVPEVERVIESMETGRMPRAGNLVPKELIELFKVWRLTGFTPGNPEDTPSEVAKSASGCGTK